MNLQFKPVIMRVCLFVCASLPQPSQYPLENLVICSPRVNKLLLLKTLCGRCTIVDVAFSVHRNPRDTHRNVYKHMAYKNTGSDGKFYLDTFTLQFWYPGLHSNI